MGFRQVVLGLPLGILPADVRLRAISLVLMLCPFLRRAQAIGVVFVVSGLVYRWNLSVSLYL